MNQYVCTGTVLVHTSIYSNIQHINALISCKWVHHSTWQFKEVHKSPVPLNKAVHECTRPCTFMYFLVPPYSGVQDFWVFHCAAMYFDVSTCWISRNKCQNSEYVLVHTGMCLDVLVHTGMLLYCMSQYILVGYSMYQYIPVHTTAYLYVPVHASSYQYIPVLLNKHILVHTSKYQYIPMLIWVKKKVRTGFEPEILCIICICFPTSLRECRHHLPDM